MNKKLRYTLLSIFLIQFLLFYCECVSTRKLKHRLDVLETRYNVMIEKIEKFELMLEE